MKRFTVSLPDDVYTALRAHGEKAVPPASLQQMIRHSVDLMLTNAELAPEPDRTQDEAVAAATAVVIEPVDLLVFSVRDVSYGIPIKMVETVAAGLAVHAVPSSSGSLVGVVGFRDTLTQVHDGGFVLQGSPLAQDEGGSMLAVPGATERVLLTVTSIAGLTSASASKWAAPPPSSPAWVMALAWNDDSVVAVIDPYHFSL